MLRERNHQDSISKRAIEKKPLYRLIHYIYERAYDNLYQKRLLTESVSTPYHSIEGEKQSNLARAAIVRSMYALGLLPTPELRRLLRVKPGDDIGFKSNTVGNRRNLVFGSDTYLRLENASTVFIKKLAERELNLKLPLEHGQLL